MGRKERRAYEKQLRKREGLSKEEARRKVYEIENPDLTDCAVMIDYEAYIRSKWFKEISDEMREHLENNKWAIYMAKPGDEPNVYDLQEGEDSPIIRIHGRYLRPLSQPKATLKTEDGEEKSFTVDTDSRNIEDIVKAASEQAAIEAEGFEGNKIDRPVIPVGLSSDETEPEEVEFVEAEVVGVED